MNENVTEGKYSNVEVTNKTVIGNLNFRTYDNIVYVNNVLNTNENNILLLDKSNTTYIIQNLSSVEYKKTITQIEKSNKDIFTSNNHNLKKNDIIKLHNIRRLKPDSTTEYINLLQDNIQANTITYKVITNTRNTFTLKTFGNSTSSLNNISNIIKTSNQNIDNGYFELTTTKTLLENKVCKINISNNNTDDLGVFHNIIINDDATSLEINTLGDDKLIGYINIGRNDLISNDIIEQTDSKTKLLITDIPLKYSTFELINIQKNIWFIKGHIFSNKITHKLTYDTEIEDYKIDNANISIKNFYKNFIYEFDISDPSLLDYLFIITDSDNKHHYKNILQSGEMGHPNSFIRIYIDPSETLDYIYKIKYKKIKTNLNYEFIPLYTIKSTPLYFHQGSQTTCNPIAVNGYYPLYTTIGCAQSHVGGNGSYHSHNLGTPPVTYYMPNGLNQDSNVGPITQWHGNYVETSSTTSSSTTNSSTTNQSNQSNTSTSQSSGGSSY